MRYLGDEATIFFKSREVLYVFICVAQVKTADYFM